MCQKLLHNAVLNIFTVICMLTCNPYLNPASQPSLRSMYVSLKEKTPLRLIQVPARLRS
jgi:hypothetical protein